ncbi:MAG: hypothetical protein WDN08_18840 [Rhizomicrobium sp.]
MAVAGAVDELRRDAHAVARLAHAAFEHMAHFQLARDLEDIDMPALEGEGGVACDDRQRRDLAEVGDDVLADAVGEVFLLGVAAHIGEGQDADRQLVRRGRALVRDRHDRPHRKGMHRPLMRLHRMLAQVLEGARHLAVDTVADHPRQRHAARRGQGLDPGRDVDALAIDVVALDDHLAEVDADAVADAAGLGRLLGRRLDRQGAFDGGDHAGEFHQGAVAHQLEQPPAMDRDLRIEDAGPVRLQPLQRAGLVGLHQAAIADDVGGQDRGQFALHGSRCRRSRAS